MGLNEAKFTVIPKCCEMLHFYFFMIRILLRERRVIKLMLQYNTALRNYMVVIECWCSSHLRLKITFCLP